MENDETIAFDGLVIFEKAEICRVVGDKSPGETGQISWQIRVSSLYRFQQS